MKTTKIFTIFAIISVIGSAALLLNILSPAAANAECTGAGCRKVDEQNPLTKNPHPQDEPQGNPHQFDSGCSGNTHGQKNALSSQECPGA